MEVNPYWFPAMFEDMSVIRAVLQIPQIKDTTSCVFLVMDTILAWGVYAKHFVGVELRGLQRQSAKWP